jgi:DNA-directed RNA polymerase specialized sigma24 family protein
MMQRAAVLDRGLDRVSQSDHQAEAAIDQAMVRAGAPAGRSATSELVARASHGDQAAWDQLVERYAGMVWAIARADGLGRDDAADVSQVTWLLLTQHLGLLREPEELGGWLHATATREAFRVCRLRGRDISFAAKHHLGATSASQSAR